MSKWTDKLVIRFLEYLENSRLSDDSDLIAFLRTQLDRERDEDQ